LRLSYGLFKVCKLRAARSEVAARTALHLIRSAAARLAADEIAAGTLMRPFGERELPVRNAYWIVRAQRTPRHAVNVVVEWLKLQGQAADRLR
jgi:hypothetical protein